MDYIECKLNNTPLTWRWKLEITRYDKSYFRCLGSIVQNDGEIEGAVIYKIQFKLGGWNGGMFQVLSVIES